MPGHPRRARRRDEGDRGGGRGRAREGLVRGGRGAIGDRRRLPQGEEGSTALSDCNGDEVPLRHEGLTIVDGFPKVIDSTRGEQLLGMQPCADVSTLIREYMADFPAALVAELQLVGAEVSARL